MNSFFHKIGLTERCISLVDRQYVDSGDTIKTSNFDFIVSPYVENRYFPIGLVGFVYYGVYMIVRFYMSRLAPFVYGVYLVERYNI